MQYRSGYWIYTNAIAVLQCLVQKWSSDMCPLGGLGTEEGEESGLMQSAAAL